jgi:hypothetical protein
VKVKTEPIRMVLISSLLWLALCVIAILLSGDVRAGLSGVHAQTKVACVRAICISGASP